MSSPRVLFITDHFPPQIGGAAISAERLTRLLAARELGIHVLHLEADVESGAVESSREGDVMVHRLGGLGSADLTLQLADNAIRHLQERVGFQIIHGHFLMPSGYLAAFYAKLFGVGSFVGVRGNDVDRGMFVGSQLPFILWALQHAGAIGCVSRDLVKKCGALCGREDIHFTPNSVDIDVFRPQPKDAQLLESFEWQGEALLGFVGELRIKKGTQSILDAFRMVRARQPVKLLLVGGIRSEDRSFLRRYLRQFPDLRPDLHLVDYIQDRAELVKYYNLMDIVLSPSLWDGMPNSVLEAMACGRLVLASNVGGIRDAVSHGNTGFLVDVHELHRLGEGCLEVIGAGQQATDDIGRRARAYVQEHHTPAQEGQQMLDIYTSLGSSTPS